MSYNFGYGLGLTLASSFGIINILLDTEWWTMSGLLGLGIVCLILGLIESKNEVKV